MYKRILAPIDGSDAAQRGLQEAIAIAFDQRASLTLLYVIDASMTSVDPSTFLAYDELLGALRTTGASVLAKGTQLAKERGVSVSSKVIETPDRRVAPAIVDEAGKSDCDLIVMGTHGRRGLSHLVLGSDAEVVIKTSPVPVLLVRPTPERTV
jgi:nucleotide-binding universal stress UspA family protein